MKPLLVLLGTLPWAFTAGLAVIKVVGRERWSWWTVTAPLWVPFLAGCALGLILLGLAVIEDMLGICDPGMRR
uniref:Uncharacterized protein n=1 Tax=viral metagenome TaxID=1070528 RepID=A0A6M3LRK7_9ZZZZ